MTSLLSIEQARSPIPQYSLYSPPLNKPSIALEFGFASPSSFIFISEHNLNRTDINAGALSVNRLIA